MKILINDESFGRYDLTASKMLANNGVETVDNIFDAEGIIAGTEIYDADMLARATNLKVISRMGVGYDGIDLDCCKAKGIMVTYTPEAPAGSVAELTIAQMINMLRYIPDMNKRMHEKLWRKRIGKKLSEVVVGVIGVGRIGSRVIERLLPFKPKEIFAYDTDFEKATALQTDYDYGHSFEVSSTLGELLAKCDIVTVHIPMSEENSNYINSSFLTAMKNGSYLINTSRGGILDLRALEHCVNYSPSKLLGVALDVFSDEPYHGGLTVFEHVIMTPHAGSMTLEARYKMETLAVEDCMGVLNGNQPLRPIPELENAV